MSDKAQVAILTSSYLEDGGKIRTSVYWAVLVPDEDRDDDLLRRMCNCRNEEDAKTIRDLLNGSRATLGEC